MNDDILKRELRRIAIENQHRCFGCGYEHRCSIHGCAIIRQALERLERLERLEGGTNAPLTLDELREMDGNPVFIRPLECDSGVWALVNLEYELCRTAKCAPAIFDTYGTTWTAYRRPPEEVFTDGT